ncbi:MAG: hypothetical protein ABJC09_08665, partial [Terriglobia bacterium]
PSADARFDGLCDLDQASREKAQATLVKNTGQKAKEFEDMREAFADPRLHLEAGPKFTGDSTASRLLTRDAYHKPYVV